MQNKVFGITLFEQYVYTNLPNSVDKESMLNKVSDNTNDQPKDTPYDPINCKLMMNKIKL